MPASESRRAKKAFLVFRKLTQSVKMRSDSFLKIEEHLMFRLREEFV